MNPDDRAEAGEGAVQLQARRFVRAVLLAVAVIVVDFLAFFYAVPWVDERVESPLISPGYILVFFVILCNLVVLIGIVAYVLHDDSYPSDRWR